MAKSVGALVAVTIVSLFLLSAAQDEEFDALYTRFHTSDNCDSEVLSNYDGIGELCVPIAGSLWKVLGGLSIRCDGDRVRLKAHNTFDCSDDAVSAEFDYPTEECVQVTNPFKPDGTVVGGFFSCARTKAYTTVCLHNRDNCSPLPNSECVMDPSFTTCMNYGSESVRYTCGDTNTYQIFTGEDCKGDTRTDLIDISVGNCSSITLDKVDLHQQFACVGAASEGSDGDGSGDGVTGVTRSCFAAESEVYIPNGTMKRIDELNIGDHVESYDSTGHRVFSEVFLIQHENERNRVPMKVIIWQTETGRKGSITLTDTHHIQTSLSGDYKPAGEFAIGDTIFVSRQGETKRIETAVVRAVRTQMSLPRNIHTLNDKIIVNGVLTTPFANTFGIDTFRLRHLLAPLKAMYKLGGFTTTIATVDRVIHEVGYHLANVRSRVL